MFCCYILEAYTFLMRDRKGMHPDVRGGTGRRRGRGNCNQVYCVRKNIFNGGGIK